MFGFKNHGANVYAKMGLETGVIAASPNKLIVMLYDGAILAAKQAVVHMQKKDYEQKGESISKAVLIIEGGLRLCLDKKAGGEIAQSLDALYAYMTQRLTLANIRNQPELIEEVVKLLVDLKSAWETIEQQQLAKASASSMNSNPYSGLQANLSRMAVGT